MRRSLPLMLFGPFPPEAVAGHLAVRDHWVAARSHRRKAGRHIARMALAAWALLISFIQAPSAMAQAAPEASGALHPNPDASCRVLYLGIVGGLETAHHKHSGLVQIRNMLRGPAYPDVCAETYSPYFWPFALRWVRKHFPAHRGRLTPEELDRAPRVVIVGHSLGGWAALAIARRLERKGIPVELTVQFASVGITDLTVPRNVKAAANFYVHDALGILTTKRIKVKDPARTKLLGNTPLPGLGHESGTRAAAIRELVLSTVDFLRAASAAPEARPAAGQPPSPPHSPPPPDVLTDKQRPAGPRDQPR